MCLLHSRPRPPAECGLCPPSCGSVSSSQGHLSLSASRCLDGSWTVRSSCKLSLRNTSPGAPKYGFIYEQRDSIKPSKNSTS